MIQVSRPIFWPLLPLVYWFGLKSGRADLDWVAAVQMASLSFPLCLVGAAWNDIYDYESDRRSPRRRLAWAATVRREDHGLLQRTALIVSPLIVLAACLTGDWLNVSLTALLVIGTWAYSVPPLRLKERPPLDSLSNGLGCFLLPFALGYSMGADLAMMSLKYYLLALCVAGVHALAAAADYGADKAAGHRTLAVAYGRRAAAVFAFAAFLATWQLTNFYSAAVRYYLAVAVIATFVPVVFPRHRPIMLACGVIFVGFLVAAAWHLFG